MTLLLIVTIVFLIVWWKDSSDKKAEHEQYKRDTITNLELEKEIRKKWINIIDDRLRDERNSSVEPFDLIMGFYDEYCVPIDIYPSTNEEVQKKLKEDKIKAGKECISFAKDYIWNLQFYYKNASKIACNAPPKYVFVESLGQSQLLPVTILSPIVKASGQTCYYDEGLFTISENRKFYDYQIKSHLERETQYETNKAEENLYWGVNACLSVKDRKITNYHLAMCCPTILHRYSTLIRMLTRKELATYGFKPCPYGVGIGKESAWQESAKRQARLEEEKKKYPWL
ncbi:MAG: hypothetical protein J6A24_04785 [Clostridia bacterium]|nr:hypothetical protein [Clostridia bacterium]